MSTALLPALLELVRLKDLKDRAMAMNCKARGEPGRVRAAMLREYEAAKEPAWTAARAAVRAALEENT